MADTRCERSSIKIHLLLFDLKTAGLNYIKGYRYELYCIVRAVGTTHCCVWVDTPHSAAKVRNDSAGDAGYDTKMFEELWLRFEPPDPRNRWDAPMIKVFGSIGDADGALPSVQIAGGVVGGRRAPAFTSKFIGTVVSTPEALAAAEAVAGTVISSSGSSFAGGASPVAAVPTLDVSPAAAAVPKKSAFKRAQPAAPAPVASNVMTGPDTEVDAPPADALPSDADADGLDGLGDLVGGDAAEEADVEAARQRIAALAVQAQAAQSWHVSRRQADSNDVGLPETPAAAGLLQGQPHDRQEACRAVRAALFSRRGYKPPLAVLAVSAAPANYVSEVDTRSAAIMEHLTSSLATRGAITGDVIAVPGSAVPFAVRRMVTPLELKRLKREVRRHYRYLYRLAESAAHPPKLTAASYHVLCRLLFHLAV